MLPVYKHTECKEFKEMKCNWKYENAYIFWVRKNNFSTTKARARIFAWKKKQHRKLLFPFHLYIGEFGFEDFVTVLTFRMRQADLEEDLQKAFKIFDRDGDGYITVKELRYLMTNLGERYTEEEVTEMIREVDLDCKGKVDFHGNEKIVRVVMTFNASKRLYFLYALTFA